jgi:RNA polymerase sigma-B factor
VAADVQSRERAIERHLPLVRAVARRYLRSGEPLDDLVQVGTIGLIKAVDRFDPARDRDLAALARPAIEGEIRHHLRDRTGAVRISRPDRELAARLRVCAQDLRAQGAATPTVAELARAAGVDEDRAARALQATEAARAVPLDPDGDAGDIRATRGGADEATEARVLLSAGWSALDDRDRRLLELRYHEDRSQADIARELGLSQAHVSRLLRAALARLRAEVGAEPAAEDAAVRQRADGDAARSGRLLLRLPQTLHAELAAAAQREGVALNTFIAGTLAASIGWREAGGAADVHRAAPDPGPPARRPRAHLLLVLNAALIALAAVAGFALLVAAAMA